MSKQGAEGSRKLDTALFALGLTILVLSDIFGYDKNNAGKLVKGVADSLDWLDGSGHSVGTGALMYGCLCFLNAISAVERPFTAPEKRTIALLFTLAQELAGQSIGTVLDIKDVAVIPPTVLFMYYVEVLCGRLRSIEIWHKVRDTFTGK